MVKLDPEVNQCDVKLSKDLLKVKVKQKINIKKDKRWIIFWERGQTNLPSNKLNILTKKLEKGREGPLSCWCSFGDEERTLDRSKHLHSGGRQGYQERLARIGFHKNVVLFVDDMKNWFHIWWYFIGKNIRMTWQEKVEAATLACSKHPGWVTHEHPPSDDLMSCLLFLSGTNRLPSIRERLKKVVISNDFCH